MNTELVGAIMAIVGVILIVVITNWSKRLSHTAAREWIKSMDRAFWVVEELDNEYPVDITVAESIAQKRMEKLDKHYNPDVCRVVVIFSQGERQYKCSGIYRSQDSYITRYVKPKAKWFPLIAKEAVRQNGYDNATIITYLVTSPVTA